MDYRAMKLDYFSIFNEKIIINSQQLNRHAKERRVDATYSIDAIYRQPNICKKRQMTEATSLNKR